MDVGSFAVKSDCVGDWQKTSVSFMHFFNPVGQTNLEVDTFVQNSVQQWHSGESGQ